MPVRRARALDRRVFFRRAALAPLCLCLVASLHAYRVFCCEQTPWKGGGFGMFSTVDERAARYVRAYLVTPQGEIPVPLPDILRRQASQLRAAPSQAELDRLARRLAEFRWQDERQRWESVALQLSGHPDDKPVSDFVLNQQAASPAPPETPFGMPVNLVPHPAGRNPRPLAEVPFSSVRVELWRYQFRADTNELRGRKFLEASARPEGAA